MVAPIGAATGPGDRDGQGGLVTMPHGMGRWVRLRGPELTLAALALLTFIGVLGAVDLWGKREQRLAAETLDTVEHSHWLIAEIQGRQRLEKPPLPRWTTAALILLIGQRDEWVVRLPSAMSAVGIVLLVYDLGRRLGGRSIGLASGLAMCATFYAITEHRQAGNDGPLAFFTTLALYAAWRRLHGSPNIPSPADVPPADVPGTRSWSILMYSALGLGFLTKGPIIHALVLLTLIPYLALTRRLKAGSRALIDWRGILLMIVLALSWPVPVAIVEPEAIGVWLLEIGQKVGSAGVAHHDFRAPLVLEWFWMVMPWTPLAVLSLALPFLKRGQEAKPRIWFPWLWAFANLAMFSTWSVAKPNYYLPCLPGVALLVGREWVRVSRMARGQAPGARRLLQGYWVSLFVVAVSAPVVTSQLAPEYLLPVLALGLSVAAGTVASAWMWHRGADAGALAPITASIAVSVLIIYGAVARPYFDSQSHRPLANTLEKLLPPEERTVMFYHELDEGLWFYLRNRELVPVPGSQPHFNDGYELMVEDLQGRLIEDPRLRLERELNKLLEWIDEPRRSSRYLLIRDRLYDQFAPALSGITTEIYRERNLRRNELVLLRINEDAAEIAEADVTPQPDKEPKRR